MRIRDAILSELPEIAAIYDHEVRTSTNTFDTEFRDSDEQRTWFDAHESEVYPLVVASDDGTVLGWASLSPWSERGAYARTVELSVFVQRQHRGRGVARELLTEVVARARRAGHRVILGRIEASNEASRKLLVKAGFASVGVMHRVGEKFGRPLDVEVLELVLG
jgi:L-amino acid N-acyltransferase YncA